jgi:hypothetical protein
MNSCKSAISKYKKSKKKEIIKEVQKSETINRILYITTVEIDEQNILVPRKKKQLYDDTNNTTGEVEETKNITGENQSRQDHTRAAESVFNKLIGEDGILTRTHDIKINNIEFFTGYYIARHYLPKIMTLMTLDSEKRIPSLHLGCSTPHVIDGFNVFLRRQKISLSITGIDKNKLDYNHNNKENLYINDADAEGDITKCENLTVLTRKIQQVYEKKFYLFTSCVRPVNVLDLYKILLFPLEVVDRYGIVLIRLCDRQEFAAFSNDYNLFLAFVQYYYRGVNLFVPPWSNRLYIMVNEKKRNFTSADSIKYNNFLKKNTPPTGDDNEINRIILDIISNDVIINDADAYKLIMDVLDICDE